MRQRILAEHFVENHESFLDGKKVIAPADRGDAVQADASSA
jgi:hypothetical protein